MSEPAYNPIPNQMSDEDLVSEILSLQAEADEADLKVKRAKNELLERKAKEIKIALMQKDEPFGAVSQIIGANKVTMTTPKKVVWSQEGLAELYAQIAADKDEDVNEYITIEYKVSESAYKNWPSPLKATFEPNRTVTPGNVANKIEPAKEK